MIGRRRKTLAPVAYATCGGLGCGLASSRPNGCSGALALDRSRRAEGKKQTLGGGVNVR